MPSRAAGLDIIAPLVACLAVSAVAFPIVRFVRRRTVAA